LPLLSVDVVGLAGRLDLPQLYAIEQFASVVHRPLSRENVTINSPRIKRTAAGVKMEKWAGVFKTLLAAVLSVSMLSVKLT
jgi:hypothetical protein